MVHEDEPPTKVIIRDDDDIMPDPNAGSSRDIGEMKQMEEDDKIMSMAIMGKSLQELYSNETLKIASDRICISSMVRQLNSTDVSEIFSPERGTALCKKHGLKPGEAMDIKNGYDFDSLPTEISVGNPFCVKSQP